MLSLLLLACSHDLPFVHDGSATIDDALSGNGDPCTYGEAVLAADDADLGFAAEDVAAFVGDRSAELTYADGSTAGMQLVGEIDGDVLLLTSTPKEEGVTCPDPVLAVPLAMRFVTDDGVFDAAWTETVRVSAFSSADGLYLGAYVDADDVGGTFDHPGMTELSLPVNYAAASFSGEVVAVVEGGEEVATTECGIAAWNGPLQTGC